MNLRCYVFICLKMCADLLIKLILNFTSLALALLAGLTGFLSATWTSTSTAHYASMVAIICGIVPFWTVRFCSDILSNAVDAVFICWSIDIDSGANHCSKAMEAVS